MENRVDGHGSWEVQPISYRPHTTHNTKWANPALAKLPASCLWEVQSRQQHQLSNSELQVGPMAVRVSLLPCLGASDALARQGHLFAHVPGSFRCGRGFRPLERQVQGLPQLLTERQLIGTLARGTRAMSVQTPLTQGQLSYPLGGVTPQNISTQNLFNDAVCAPSLPISLRVMGGAVQQFGR